MADKESNTKKGKINYRKIFFEAYPETEGKVVVHHAIEQQVLKYYNEVDFTEQEINSLHNLRGIPKELDNKLHKSTIRIEWNKFYKENANPAKEQFIQKMKQIDEMYGNLYNQQFNEKGEK